MNFASDNAGPVHPKVMEALVQANTGFVPSYGADPLMEAVTEKMRAVFEAPNAVVRLVATGTAGNVLALATLAQPFDTIFCTPMAHIEEDECNAPEFYTGGAKLTLVEARNGKMVPAALEVALAGAGASVHNAQKGPVSITNVTERGTVYSVSETEVLCSVAKGHRVAVHLDGARFANAVVATGASPAELTWKAGIDAVTFGGTKNGLMGAEAVVFFDPALDQEFQLRRKRGAHLFSKHRYLSAQMLAALKDGLWLEMAQAANDAARVLADGLAAVQGVRLLHPVEANVIWAALPEAVDQKLREAGVVYHGSREGSHIRARFVCDWSIGRAGGERALAVLA